MKIQKLAVIYGAMILLSGLLIIPGQVVWADQIPVADVALENDGGLIPALQKTNAITVTTTIDSMANDGQCSLREAIYSANTNPGIIPLDECAGGADDQPDRIILADGAVYNLTLNNGIFDPPASIGDLDIVDDLPATDLYIVVAGGGTATIDAHIIEDRILDIQAGAAVIVTGVTFTGGNSVLNGGAIRNAGSLTLNDSVVIENEAGDNGAGIYNDTAGATLTLVGTEVLSNTAGVGIGSAFGGGGIYNGSAAALVIQESTISFNYTHDDGGGLFNQGVVTISDSLFEANESRAGPGGGTGGGAIHNTEPNAEVTITNTIFRGHKAGAGGAIYNDEDSEVTLEDSLLEGNWVVSTGRGGAIYNEGDFWLRHSNVHDNEAKQGGAIYNGNATSQMWIEAQSNIYENEATDSDGGGIYVSNGTVWLSSSSVMSNTTAEYGGGVTVGSNGTVILANTTLGGNNAGLEGGGLAARNNGFAELYNVTVARNNAPVGTALHKFDTAGISLANSIIAGAAGSTCGIPAGVLLSTGHNLFSDDTCALLVVQIGDQFDADPQLAEMTAQNDTYLYEPLSGSPAIDTGDATVCGNASVNNVDQLGNARPIGDGCEIGAVETAGAIDPPGEDDPPGGDDGPPGGGEIPSLIFLPLVIK